METASSKVPNLTNLILRATERMKNETAELSEKDAQPSPAMEEKPHAQSQSSVEKYAAQQRPNDSVTENAEQASVSLEKQTTTRIEDLIGNQSFKDLCCELRDRAPAIQRNATESFFFSSAYLFSVNSGNGYKTSLSLLEELMQETGLFPEKASRSEYVLPAPSDADAAQKISNIIGTLEYAFSAPRIVTFDISSWLDHTGEQLFKNLLMHIFQHNTKCLVVFRIPYVREKLLSETSADISDIISARNVVFEPFTNEELRRIAERIIAPYRLSFSPDAAEKFDLRIEQEKSNGYFYGIHTVRKIVGDFIREMELQGQNEHTGNKTITGAVIEHAAPAVVVEDHSPGFETFGNLIGMDSVESRLREVIYQIQFARSTGLSSRPCMHMFFVGNPGTGKTTVARMLGNELKKQGVLRIGKFYEHKGRDLCAEYVGQTTPKTVAICRQAYGSVLFIDEAYSLAAGNGQNDYGKEAVDALIAEMENHYDDLVVIFAGYPEDMEKLLSLNPGMRSRVPYTIEFPNYSREDLVRIFARMSSEHFVHAPGFDDRAARFFMNLPQSLLDDRSFGNARFVRNIYERVWGKATARCARNGNANIELTVEDFEAAIAEFKRI